MSIRFKRILHARTPSGAQSNLELCIGPVDQDEMSWYCLVECNLLFSHPLLIRGEDELQALELAVKSVAGRIASLSSEPGYHIWWLDEEDEGGLILKNFNE